MCRICSWPLARSSALRSASLGGVKDDTRSCLGGVLGAARWRCKARSHHREPLGPGSGVAFCHAVACRCADSRMRRQARVSAMTYAARAVGSSDFILKTWGKRSASGRRQPLVVKAGGRCGHVVNVNDVVHMSMPTPPCPHSAGRAVLRPCSSLGLPASAVVFVAGSVQLPAANTDRIAPPFGVRHVL